MTTVALKDGQMACDSMQCGAYIDRINCSKIREIGVGTFVGFAGDLVQCYKFLDWVEQGMDADEYPEDLDDVEAIIVGSSGAAKYYDESPIGIPVGKTCAIGSGSAFAMGAMLAGKSAYDAVNIACELDPLSRGPISYKVINPETVRRRK